MNILDMLRLNGIDPSTLPSLSSPPGAATFNPVLARQVQDFALQQYGPPPNEADFTMPTAPDVPQASGFWERLAQASGGQPFQVPHVYGGPRGLAGVRGLDAIAAVLAGMGNYAAGSAKARLDEKGGAYAEQEKSYSEALKERRDAIRKAFDEYRAHRGKAIEFGVTMGGKQAASQPEKKLTPEEIRANERAKYLGRADAGFTPDRGGTHEADDELEAASDAVESGQTKLTDYPYKMRGPITATIRDRAGMIYPEKVRNTLEALNAAEAIVGTIEELSRKVNTKPGGVAMISGAIRGAKAGAGLDDDAALLSSAREGFVATIARATGERGVLTERDASRARNLLVSVFSSRTVAPKKIRLLRNHLEMLRKMAIATRTERLAGRGDGVRPTKADEDYVKSLEIGGER